MNTFPPEVSFYIISFFPLVSLIAARGVSTRWRYFIQTASHHPARKALLDLYLAAIAHPNFPSLAQALRPRVREFDREAYLADLTSRGCVLPDVFELWILEWPSKAVHFLAWPGLLQEDDFPVHHEHYYDLGNLLSETTLPIIDAIPVPSDVATGAGTTTCQGFALWGIRLWIGGGVARLWMVVDANEAINDRRGAGRLVWAHSYYADELDDKGPEHSRRIFSNPPFLASDLIEFLGQLDMDGSAVVDTIQGYYCLQDICFIGE